MKPNEAYFRTCFYQLLLIKLYTDLWIPSADVSLQYGSGFK